MNEPKFPMLANPDAIFRDENGFWYAGQIDGGREIRWGICNEYDNPPERYMVTGQTAHGANPTDLNVRSWLDDHRTMMRHRYLRKKSHTMHQDDTAARRPQA